MAVRAAWQRAATSFLCERRPVAIAPKCRYSFTKRNIDTQRRGHNGGAIAGARIKRLAHKSGAKPTPCGQALRLAPLHIELEAISQADGGELLDDHDGVAQSLVGRGAREQNSKVVHESGLLDTPNAALVSCTLEPSPPHLQPRLAAHRVDDLTQLCLHLGENKSEDDVGERIPWASTRPKFNPTAAVLDAERHVPMPISGKPAPHVADAMLLDLRGVLSDDGLNQDARFRGDFAKLEESMPHVVIDGRPQRNFVQGTIVSRLDVGKYRDGGEPLFAHQAMKITGGHIKGTRILHARQRPSGARAFLP